MYANNIYVPHTQDGNITMVPVDEDPSYDSATNPKICVQFDENEARDIKLYIKSIDSRLETIKE